jgi:hypothetical protein
MLVEKQAWFARLIAQGVSNSEACRVVGINREDGNTLAVRAHNPQHCRSGGALSAGETHNTPRSVLNRCAVAGK